jgi:hypothetical protein
MKALGFPQQFSGLSQAPFDTLSDFFRGTKGAMLDMFRCPDKVLEACEKLLPIMLEFGLEARRRGHKRIFIPIHKGLDGFMSPKQFNTFFWPACELIVSFIEAGLNRLVPWKDCTSRLETIVTSGRQGGMLVQRTDIFRRKILKQSAFACVPCPPCAQARRWGEGLLPKLIDAVGRNGGFIMDASACWT